MRCRFSLLTLGLAPWLGAVTQGAEAQAAWRDTHCYHHDEPGRTLSFPLPAAHALDLRRSTDPSDVDGSECTASVRDREGSVIWRAAGFGAGLDPWTGHDVDGDGLPDAMVTVDRGGGNRCCWHVHVLRLGTAPVTVDTLDPNVFFRADEGGRTVLWDIVPFYELGPDMADAPLVRLARQYRGGRLVDVTAERCPTMLADTARDLTTLRAEWDEATPDLRSAARRGADTAWAVIRAHVAVSSLALQHLACGLREAARELVFEAWPPADAPERWRTLVSAWERVAARRFLAPTPPTP